MPMGPKGMVKPDDAELADATVDALWEFLAGGSAELDAAACIARLQEMSLDENRDGAVGEGPDSLVWKEFAKGLGAAPFERWQSRRLCSDVEMCRVLCERCVR